MDRFETDAERRAYLKALEDAAREVEEWQVYFKHSGERASQEMSEAVLKLGEQA